jgi:hypothetical protein
MPSHRQRWRHVEAVPPLLFRLEGVSAVRGREPGRRGWLTVAEGRVGDVRARRVVLNDDISLSYVVPPHIDLGPLRGAYVKVTLTDELAASGRRAQMLTLAGEGGRPLLLARFGPAGQVHALGRSRVRTALSQRPGGPLVFGTDKLQYVVHVGEHVRVRDPVGEFVVGFVARTSNDDAAYVIADKALWR